MTIKPDPTLTLDMLMSDTATNYTDQDIDAIIAYHRQSRANRAAGIKPARSKTTPSKLITKIDLASIGLGPKPSTAPNPSSAKPLRRI